MNNNTKNSNSDIPEELLELVPWYAIGKLSVDDQALFDKALVDYPLLKQLVTEEQQIIELVSEDNSLLDLSAIAPTEERLKSVLNMIDVAESQEKANDSRKSSAGTSLVDKLKSLLGIVPNANGAPQYARAASLAVLVLSVGVLTAFVAPLFTDKSDFVPASASSQVNNQTNISASAPNTILLVGYNGTSIALGSNDVLKDKLSKIETVPNKEGIYQISFKQVLTDDEIQQTINALLAQKDLIWFAGEEF